MATKACQTDREVRFPPGFSSVLDGLSGRDRDLAVWVAREVLLLVRLDRSRRTDTAKARKARKELKESSARKTASLCRRLVLPTHSGESAACIVRQTQEVIYEHLGVAVSESTVRRYLKAEKVIR